MTLNHWGQNYYMLFLLFGGISWQLSQDALQHKSLGGMNYCNVRIGAVLPCRTRLSWLQLQFFSLYCVGTNCCNVMPFLCRILVFRI